MTETKSRYFRLYVDGKTIKEISEEEHREVWRVDLGRVNKRLLCRVRPNEIHFSEGCSGLTIPTAQLGQILVTLLRYLGDSS